MELFKKAKKKFLIGYTAVKDKYNIIKNITNYNCSTNRKHLLFSSDPFKTNFIHIKGINKDPELRKIAPLSTFAIPDEIPEDLTFPLPEFERCTIDLFEKYPRQSWETNTLNPTLIQDDSAEGFHFLYVAHDQAGKKPTHDMPFISYIGYAHLDKSGFKVDSKNSEPAIKAPLMDEYLDLIKQYTQNPSSEILEKSKDNKFFPDGLMDPRITKMNENGKPVYYIICNASNLAQTDYKDREDRNKSIKGAYIYMVKTHDFKKIDHVGVIGPEIYDKNAFLLSQKIKINGKDKLALFHRIFPNIQVTFFDSFEELKNPAFWDNELQSKNLEKNTVLKPLFNWEGHLTKKQKGNETNIVDKGFIGGGAPPVEVTLRNGKKAWLIIYHSVDTALSKEPTGTKTLKQYFGSAAILNYEDPRIVLSRSAYPILSPYKEPFSLKGNSSKTIMDKIFENYKQFDKTRKPKPVTFPSGNIVINDKLHIYYGAMDTEIRVAKCNLQDLVDFISQFDANGNPF